MRLLFFALLLASATGAGAQQDPPHVPAPIFRVPYQVVPAPLDSGPSSSLPVYGPPPPPQFGPLPAPYPPRPRRYFQPGGPYGSGDFSAELILGLLLAGFLFGCLVAAH